MRVQGSGEEGTAATRLLRFPGSTADPSRLSRGGRRGSGLAETGERRRERRGAKAGETEGRWVPQPRWGSSPPPPSEPKMAAEWRRQSGGGSSSGGREGGRERRAPRTPPPPTPPSWLSPPAPLARLRRRSAHARPHAPEWSWARRSRLPPTTTLGRPARPPARTRSLQGASSPRSRPPRGPCRAGAGAALTRTSSGASPSRLLLGLLSFPPPFPAPTATNSRRGRRRLLLAPPPTFPPPLARASPTIPPAGLFHSGSCGAGRRGRRARAEQAVVTGPTRVADGGLCRLTPWPRLRGGRGRFSPPLRAPASG